MISVKSYFSGAGGMDLGLELAGLKILESFELDTKCCNTLKSNFNHKISQEDITQITVLDQQNADVYVGTFPCQKYSNIASISGTRKGEDLFLHFFRHVVLARPEVFIIENVPGMKYFPVVMEAFTKLPEYYSFEYVPLKTTNWLPQERNRLIIIGTKHKFEFEKHPSKQNKKSMKDIVDVGIEVHTPKYVTRRLNGHYRDKPIITTLDGIAPTCVAHYSKDRSTRLINDGINIRPYSVKEYGALQGFPKDFIFNGTENDAYRQIGNAVPVDMAKWLGQQIINYFNSRKNRNH